MSEVVKRVVELFDSTCEKQFESMHCEIRPISSAECENHGNVICASINCYSDDINITLVISANEGFLLDTIPMNIEEEQNLLLVEEDWCLELANRFLGRLKNKLLSHGCTLQMGLPTIIDSGAGERVLNEGENLTSRAFQIVDAQKTDQIQCALSINILNTGMELDDYEDEDEDWFDESELEHL